MTKNNLEQMQTCNCCLNLRICAYKDFHNQPICSECHSWLGDRIKLQNKGKNKNEY